MLIQDRIQGRDLIITYSDAGKMIEQVGTGWRYAGAVDPDYMHREYIETDEDISAEELRDMVWEREDRDAFARLDMLEDVMCEQDMANEERIAAIEDALCEMDMGGEE